MIDQNQFNKGLDFETKRLAKWCTNTDSPLDACESLIFHLINNMNASYYEVIGMLEEIKLNYREIVREVNKEESSEESNETFD